jgi:carbonic anhydrase
MNRVLAFLLPVLILGCGGATPRESPGTDERVQVGPLTRSGQAEMTTAAALKRLQQGNDRFVRGTPFRRDLPAEIRITAEGQYPFAAILHCIDSRSSAELVFDQGLGDLFSVRVAGNIVNQDVLGSLEFATKAVGAKLIVVMGHSSCGAVKGCCDRVTLGHVTQLVERIAPARDATVSTNAPDRSGKNAMFVDAVAKENVRQSVRQLTEQSPVLRDLVARDALRILGGFQDLKSGRVEFFE